MSYTDLLLKAKQKHTLTEAEIFELLSNPAASAALFEAADETRKNYVGDGVYLRGLIEFSSFCRQNCNYCGLRRDNKKAVRYRLTKEQIIDFIKRNRVCTTEVADCLGKTGALENVMPTEGMNILWENSAAPDAKKAEYDD